MKRLLICLLAGMLLCASALADEVVELPDAIVTYTPPEGFYLLTRESSASAFTAIGLRQRDLLPWMEQNDAYAILYDLETGSELLLHLYPAEDEPLEDLTPQELSQLRQSWAEDLELNGYEEVTTDIHEDEGGLWLWSRHKTYTQDGTPCWIMTMIAVRSGTAMTLSLFSYGAPPEDELTDRAMQMAAGVRLTLPESLTVLSADGVTVRLQLPEGMALQDDAALLSGLTPEEPAGEVIGIAVAEDGSWYIQWQLVEGVTGDLERVRDTGLRSLYEDRAKRKTAAGFTVTGKESVTDLRQKYIRLSYEMPQEGGDSWFAEEYYTKQGGWGVVVTAYSCGQPLTEEASRMLRELIASQLITVEAE